MKVKSLLPIVLTILVVRELCASRNYKGRIKDSSHTPETPLYTS